MLWKGFPLRRSLPADAVLETAAAGPLLEAAGGPGPSAFTAGELASAAAPAEGRLPFRELLGRPRVTTRRVLLATATVLFVAASVAYMERHAFSAQGADLSRRLIGDENTARLESYYFRVQDRIDRTKYSILGGETDPFAQDEVVVTFVAKPGGEIIDIEITRAGVALDPFNPAVVEELQSILPFVPTPLVPPTVRQLRETPEAGEGAWTTAGLPRSTPTDPLMYKTFLRPDKARPYAVVGILLVDSRRSRLHIVGGTQDPGGDRGVKGPGAIAQSDVANLLAAWNGGFKGPHGGFGMIADGKEYRPLKNGLASIAVMKDGTVRMGEWGTSLTWDPEMVAVRQNAVLLVKDGEVSKRVGEGNDTWGYVEVNSAEFITWRSAVGVTKDGHLIIAAGNALSAETLAKALWAAGAHMAMQLDINAPYVLTSMYFPQPDGSAKPQKFMDTMPDAASRFFKTQERDFMYLTLDETRYRTPR